ncbi:MAG TPA: ATP cone domain-containing protein [Draconibacterium sp.]|nr:ATP cone domain-containing protein [Draconibacterium sp.]
MQIQVKKGNGETVLFSTEKLKQALQNAGAGTFEQEKIATAVERKIYNGISTKEIYKIAFDLLKRESHKIAGRYRLKNAIMELGPTGFPFEIFVGKIFETMGYEVETGVIVKGKCVQHEVDVIARKPGEMLMIECKFHSDNRTKSSVQVPLYINSRFLDVKASWEKQYGTDIQYRGSVVCNTRFSEDAENYGKCAGLLVISWDYPGDLNLKNMIDNAGLHPITSLISLTKKDKQFLLEKGIVLCSQINENRQVLLEMGLTENQIKKVIREAENLIGK